MQVHVRKKHIARGEPDTVTQCPVALALADLLGTEVHVESTYIKLGRCRFRLPPRVRQFIRHFDTGQQVKPFTFTFTL